MALFCLKVLLHIIFLTIYDSPEPLEMPTGLSILKYEKLLCFIKHTATTIDDQKYSEIIYYYITNDKFIIPEHYGSFKMVILLII